tara:strand:- start:75 stop:2168 length:2094 start_codon:yes stop_codon:yes gene_type:complete
MKNFYKIIFLFLILSSNTLASITYKQSSSSLNSVTTALRGINFNPDGTKMYVTEGQGTEEVLQYSLSTAYDVNTATLVSTTTLTNINLPHAIEFKSDGTMMYVIDNTGTRVEQFTLSTAWDTSTLSHDEDFSVSGENQLRGLAFKPDGTRMYVIGAQQEIVYQYTLSTPWDVTTATKTTESDDFTSDESDPRNVQFNSDGTIMYIGGSKGDEINKYTLSTAYDVSTASLSDTYSVSSQSGRMRGFILADNGSKLYVTDDIDSPSENIIFEYNVSCAETITCSDPKDDKVVVGLIEAQVELSKRIIKHNTLPIIHRMEWLRRHENKDNLTNQNIKFDFSNEILASLANAVKVSNNQNTISKKQPDDWFYWSEGLISIGETGATISSSAKKIDTSGIVFGADRKIDENKIYGYALQLGKDSIDVGSSGALLDTDAYSLTLYGTLPGKDTIISEGLLGISMLDTDHIRNNNSNTLEGQRNGKQIFGSVNLGKRLNKKKFNFNPTARIDLGYTELESYKETSSFSNKESDALIFDRHEMVTGLANIGMILDNTVKLKNSTIKHNGRLEYIVDFSPSSGAKFSYVSDQSTDYNLTIGNEATHNYRVGYGFDLSTATGWSVILNYERHNANGSGHSDNLYFAAGYVPNTRTKYALNLNGSDTIMAGFNMVKNIRGFDIKFNFENDILNVNKNQNANISLSKVF